MKKIEREEFLQLSFGSKIKVVSCSTKEEEYGIILGHNNIGYDDGSFGFIDNIADCIEEGYVIVYHIS